MDRRTFLGGLVVSLGLALGSAGCGGGSGPSDLVLVPNDWEFFAGAEYRLAFFLARSSDNGAPLTLTHPFTLRVGPENGTLGPALPTVIHADGVEPTYALTTYRFDQPGVYRVSATYRGQTASLPISVIDPSNSAVPVVGSKLPAVATPTVGGPLGVNPVCTAQPPCPFHAVSLDRALAEGRQVALLFATPALCQSRFCGPVLANLQAVSSPWVGSVAFIHCEIYTDLTGQTNTAPVQAYKLEHEPLLYLAGSDGVVRVRIDNLFDRAEARAALGRAFGPGSA